jgi:hypothetical protein
MNIEYEGYSSFLALLQRSKAELGPILHFAPGDEKISKEPAYFGQSKES